MTYRVQTLTLVLGIAAAANADTLRVPSQYATIGAAMTAATHGDTVLVADGTYTGAGNKNLWFNGKAITVRSENGPENCIIDCEGAGRGFLFSGEPPASVVDGFTITNGMGSEGGGIYMYYNSNPTILNCIIPGNAAFGGDGGGGIFCALANPTITNCTITGNTAGAGGGLFLMMSSPTIRNSVIAGNTAASFGGGVYCDTESNPSITNSILWGNGPQEIFVEAAANPVLSYTDIQGGWSGIGNVNANPLFADPANGDYRLSTGSPAIDAGDNTALPIGIITDLDGNPRFVDDPNTPNTGVPGNGFNEIVDMGAYELQGEVCYADCDQSGALDVFDFLCFQNSFVAGEPYACDCDITPTPVCNIFDFLCFQTAFVGGCP